MPCNVNIYSTRPEIVWAHDVMCRKEPEGKGEKQAKMYLCCCVREEYTISCTNEYSDIST